MMKVSTCAEHGWCGDGEATMMIEIVTIPTLLVTRLVLKLSRELQLGNIIHNAVLRSCLKDVSKTS